MCLNFRSMTEADVATVAALEQRVQSHPWRDGQFIQSLASHQCSIIEYRQQLIGFCIMQPVLDEANLLLMAVDPDYQGQGYGYQLLSYAMQRLGPACSQIFLEVRESNLAAIKLYQKIGFDQIDLRKNYYPSTDGKREHALIMVCMLNPDSYGFKLD